MMTNVSFKAQSMVESVFCGLKSKFKSRMMRCCVVMGLGMSMALPAEAAISLTSDASTVCNASALTLSVTGGDKNDEYDFYKTTDRTTNWKDPFKRTYQTVVVDNMDDTAQVVIYRVVDITKNEEATITINASTSALCGKVCHSLSTGDGYLTGTDFNPVDPSKDAEIPNGVINYFGETGIKFEKGGISNTKSNYAIRNNISDFFSPTKSITPRLDGKDTSNYYFTVSKPNGRFCEIAYPAKVNAGKHYSFTMRFYLYLGKNSDGSCCSMSSASINIRTGHGNSETHDYERVRAYIDSSNTLLADVSHEQTDVARVPLSELYTTECGVLYRYEVTFYGTFPKQVQQEFYSFYPEFQQMDCENAKVAVDYISADISSVCLSHGAVCKGSVSSVSTSGFAEKAIYKWQQATINAPNDTTWSDLTNLNTSKIDITVDWIGDRYFRVFDSKNNSDTIKFVVSGMDCNPAQLDSVTGKDTMICAPETTSAYVLHLIDPGSDIFYEWTLKDPNGNDVTLGDKIKADFIDSRHSGISYLYFSENVTPGDYKMTVQLTKKEGTNILRYGDPVSMTLHVSTKPSKVDFTANPSPVCVNASPVVLTNTSTSGTYYYTWTATKGTLETTAANTTTRDNSLALTKTELCDNTSFDVTLKAASDAAGTCYKEVTKTISVKNETPAITCPTTAKTDVTLLATESAATYTLEKPTITGMDCTTDPTVTVTFSGTALDGTNLSTLGPVVKKMSELPVTVSIPATAGASGTTGGDKGVTIKYSVTNYCGSKTADCSYTVIVRDVSAPNCPPLADVLKDVSCVPISGTDVGLTVPTTTNDKCSPVGTTASIAGVGSRADGMDVINGAYKVGTTLVNWTFTDAAGNKRVCPQNVIVKDTARPEFDCSKLKDIEMTLAADQCVMPKSDVKLPAPVAYDCGDKTNIKGVATNEPENYPVGLTTIKWTFTDKSGNIKTCDQKVTINDNTPPTVTCPSDVTVDAPKNECSASVSLTPLTINDKCDGNITAEFVSRSDTKARDDKYPVGTTTVTWTFTDKSTNVTTCKQNITVKDITPPELVCGTVNSFTIPTNLNSCSVEASVVAGKITVPTAHDACDNADITLSAVRRYYRGLKGTDTPVLVTKTDGVTPAEWNTGDITYKPGYTDIYFIFKDAAGNADSCKKTVFVDDINAPSIICGTSSDTLHPAAGQCSVTIAPTDYYPGQATDICQNTKLDGTLVNLDDQSKKVPASITISSGTIVKFGWIYTTAAGQTTTCAKSITVTDDQKPIFDCANWAKKEITVTAATGDCEAKGAAVKIAIGDYPKADDNCDGTASITGVPVRSDAPKTLDDDFPVGKTTITWTFTDAKGNYVTCDQIVTVKSGIAPSINCDTLKNIFDTIPACEVTAEKLVVKTPVGRDSCAHKSVTPTFVRSDGATLTDSYPLGNTTITWTFTGISNPDLSASCSQTVNVRTSQKMVLNCPSDTTKVTAAAKQCVAQVTLNQLYAEHPCLKDAGGNAVKIAGVAYNAATKQKLDNLTPNLNAGITKIMWIFTDNSNTLADNVDTCYQIVDVLSPDKMEMNCPSAPTVESSGNQCTQEVTLTKPTVTVPCLTTPIKVEAYVGSTKLGDDLKYTFPTGDTKVKWVFTDTTHTLLNAVDSCFQTVRVLSENKLDIKCPTAWTKQVSAAGKCDADVELTQQNAKHPCLKDAGGQPLQIAGVPSVAGTGLTKNANGKYHATFPIGLTTVTWTFSDHTHSLVDSVVTCTETVNVRSNDPMVTNCLPETIKVDATPGECKKSLTLRQLHAGHPCMNPTDSINGVPSIGNSNILLTHDFRVGSTTVTWTFTDNTTHKLTDSVATCQQVIQIGNQNQMVVDCPKDIDTTIKGDCSVSVAQLNLKDPEVKDLCSGNTIIPDIYRSSDPNDKVHKVGDLANKDFKVGVLDTIVRIYSFTAEGRSADVYTCKQAIHIKDTLHIKVKCVDTLTTLPAVKGTCSLPISAVLGQLGTPKATDNCLTDSIKGEPSAKGGAALPIEVKVGDTLTIRWLFHDPIANADSDSCLQTVTVKGDLKPTHDDCSTLTPLSYVIKANCDTLIKASDIIVPNGKDACTGKTYPAEGHLIHTKTPIIGATLSVGKDTVVWVYSSPYSTAVDSCQQAIVIQTEKRLNLVCHTQDTIKITAPVHACTVPGDTVHLNPELAQNPCLANVKIKGVTARDTTQPYALGLTKIVWTYTDTTGTLINNVATCDQYVRITDTAAVSVDCEKMYKTSTFVIDNCTLKQSDLKLNPQAVTQCGVSIDPVPTRTSGKAMTDDWTIGNDTIHWTYTYLHNNKSTVCPQAIVIRDTAPVFDCSKLKDTTLVAEADKCVIERALSDFLASEKVAATDHCDPTRTIAGTFALADSSALPTQLNAGDSLHVIWTFMDSARYSKAAHCDQWVYVKGKVKPTIDCAAKTPALVDTTHGCGPDKAFSVSVPIARDTCSHQNIYGKFYHRSDAADSANAPFALGKTTITWHFVNSYGTDSSECEQEVHIYTDTVLTKDCPTDTMKFSLTGGACTQEVTLTQQYATNPCTSEKIAGVPYNGGVQLTSLTNTFVPGPAEIVWVFTDKSGNMTHNADTCLQHIQIGNDNKAAGACRDSVINKTLTAACDIDAATLDLGLGNPTVSELCPVNPTDSVQPDIWRTSDPATVVHDPKNLGTFSVGKDTVMWHYTFHPGGMTTPVNVYCKQAIDLTTDKQINLACHPEDTVKVIAPAHECTVPSSMVKLNPSVATNPCRTNVEIHGVPDRDTSLAYAVDSVTKIVWTYTDTTKTLTNSVATCTQYVKVTDKADIECDKLYKDSTFVIAECKLQEKDLKLNPQKVCDMVPVPTRTSGKAMTDDWTIGNDTIRWTYTYRLDGRTAVCPQAIVIRDTAPVFDCSKLKDTTLVAEADKCVIEHSLSNFLASEKVAATDHCDPTRTIAGTFALADSSALPTQLNAGDSLHVIWTFMDSARYSKAAHCDQWVYVKGKVKPTIDCAAKTPALADTTHGCGPDKTFSVSVPIARDTCSHQNIYGRFYKRSDAADSANAPFALGKTTITWHFVNSYGTDSSECEQEVHIYTDTVLTKDCPTDTMKFSLTGGACTQEVTLTQQYATNPCTSEKIAGVPYYGGVQLTSLTNSFVPGPAEIVWVFTDKSGNMTHDADTCLQHIQIGNDNKAAGACRDSVINKTLTAACDIDAATLDLGLGNPTVSELCPVNPKDSVQPDIWRTSDPATMVHDPKNLGTFSVGKDTVMWHYTFHPGGMTTPVNVYCKQAIDLTTDKQINLACHPEDTVKVIAPAHECTVPSSMVKLNPSVATNPCRTNVEIHGVPDRDTSLAYAVDSVTKIVWTYTDTTKTLTNSVATCTQYVKVTDKAAIECDKLYKDSTFVISECKLQEKDLKLNPQKVCDMVPVPTRTSGKAMTDDWTIGNDTIRWTYTYRLDGRTAVCPQAIVIRDTAPVFDCSKLKDTTLVAEADKCVIEHSLSDFLASEKVAATDHCDPTRTIAGTFALADSSALPTQLNAGDSLHVIWTFMDSARYCKAAHCDQWVYVKGKVKPTIDCAAKTPALADTTHGCGPDKTFSVSVPIARDTCSHQNIYGRFYKRSDAADSANAPFALGKTTITWHFVNSYGTDSSECEQEVHIYTDTVLTKDCPTDTMKFSLTGGACTQEVTLTQQYATNPCTSEKIAGVPYYGGVQLPGLTNTFVPGPADIVWIFTDKSGNMTHNVDTCLQHIQIGNDNKAAGACRDSVINKTLTAACDIDAATLDLGLGNPTVSELCPVNPTDSVQPDIWRTSDPATVVHDPKNLGAFSVGKDTVMWHYTFHPGGMTTPVNVYCKQAIDLTTDKQINLACHPEDTVKVIAPALACEVEAASVKLNPAVATNPCRTNVEIHGVPDRDTSLAYPVNEVTKITWTYTDTTKTLTNGVATCEQYVQVTDTATLKVDCATLYPAVSKLVDKCNFTSTELQLNAQAVEQCGNNIVPVATRTSGKSMTDNWLLGNDTIRWAYTYNNKVAVCVQTVNLHENQPAFNCDNLKPIALVADSANCTIDGVNIADTLNALHPAYTDTCTGNAVTGVYSFANGAPTSLKAGEKAIVNWTFSNDTLFAQSQTCQQTIEAIDNSKPALKCASDSVIYTLMSGKSATYAQIKAAGLSSPVILHECSTIKVDSVRSDGQPVDADYMAGDTVTVTWTVTDSFGNASVCRQVVAVNDAVLPELDCPQLADTVFACAGEIPAPYSTFDEFKKNGGKVTEEFKVLPNSFTVRADTVGDICKGMTLTRTYAMNTILGKETTCQQTVIAKDTIAPEWTATAKDATMHFSCTDTIPDFPDYQATDNCDANVKVEKQVTNNRSADPKTCNYYSYDIVCKYIATDACGNKAAKDLTVTYEIRDEQKPQINISKAWSDSMIVSIYLKHCNFAVPNVTSFLPSGALTDNCTDGAALKVWQKPALGDTITSDMLTPDSVNFMGETVSRSLKVYIYVQDVCGNVDSVVKKVYVPDRQSVVQILANSQSVCGHDGDANITLVSTRIRQAIGHIFVLEDNEWITVQSTFFFDCYHDAVSPENLIYSNNPVTYRGRFVDANDNENAANRYNLTKLTRRSQSGKYYFVAMDTITYCSDTLGVDLDVMEQPRIALDSALLRICEQDSIPLNNMEMEHNICVNEMGSPVTNEGWMLNGKTYGHNQPVNYDPQVEPMVYYVSNECGTTFSDSSLYVSCSGDQAARRIVWR
jgi:hypothetical protein